LSGELQTTPSLNGNHRPSTPATGAEPCPAQLQLVVQQIREMVRYVDSARDAVLLVRRANAVGKLVDEALKSYRVLEQQQFDLRQDATEAHLRTLRRAGELLTGTQLHPGGRPAQHPDDEPDADDRPITLRELGITGHESHRWQRIAKLPEDWFEEHIRDCLENRRELTTAGLLALAKRFTEEADDADLGDERPSGKEALFREYEAARDHISNVIWLDPIALASSLDPTDRRRELDRLRRWRTWMDEFERALAGAWKQRLPALSDLSS
jgi:hypothetical protein